VVSACDVLFRANPPAAVAGVASAVLAAGAGGYEIGTLLYSAGYFDAVYAWDYYSKLLGNKDKKNKGGTRCP
jgi:hypothetical protein